MKLFSKPAACGALGLIIGAAFVAAPAWAQGKPAAAAKPQPAPAAAPQAAQPQPAGSADPLIGEWSLVSAEGGPAAPVGVLSITAASHGLIGGAASGQAKLAGGAVCEFKSLLFSSISALYPDGARIQSFPLSGLIRGELKCPGDVLGVLEAFIEERDRTIGKAAGRIAWTRQGKVEKIEMISFAPAKAR